MQEIWKDVVDYEGYYQVSNLGNVRSVDMWFERDVKNMRFRKSQMLSGCVNGNGYILVVLFKHGVGKNFNVHRLVADAFIPNPENLPQINHIDGDKINNFVDNLEWVDQRENQLHAFRTGLQTAYRSYDCKLSMTVIQMNMNYMYLREYGSTMDAERDTGIANGNISGCCRGEKKSAGGYRWMYKKDYEKKFGS